jgi:predicted nucleic acid-binding protein
MNRWVVDTGPLIFLAKLDRLELLQRGADEILVPPAVLAEVRTLHDEATQKIEVAGQSWLQIQTVDDYSKMRLLLADLDTGEAEVIALAQTVNANRVVMDDLDARRFAHRVGLSVVGTMGLLLAARLRGEIPSVKAEIERLRQLGFWTSQSLVEAILQAAGE